MVVLKDDMLIWLFQSITVAKAFPVVNCLSVTHSEIRIHRDASGEVITD
jgi:hypothetical protein